MAEQMVEKNPFLMGREALSAGRVSEALEWFRKAVAEEKTPVACSYLAYCQARKTGEYRETIGICMDAIKEEPQNSAIYLNLGKIYLLSGHKRSALRSFQLGLRYGRNAEIAYELQRLGIRKAPPLPFLPRTHMVNQLIGKLMARIGVR